MAEPPPKYLNFIRNNKRLLWETMHVIITHVSFLIFCFSWKYVEVQIAHHNYSLQFKLLLAVLRPLLSRTSCWIHTPSQLVIFVYDFLRVCVCVCAHTVWTLRFLTINVTVAVQSRFAPDHRTSLRDASQQLMSVHCATNIS